MCLAIMRSAMMICDVLGHNEMGYDDFDVLGHNEMRYDDLWCAGPY